MSKLPGSNKPELPRIVPYLAPWTDTDQDPGAVGPTLGLCAGGAVGGMIAWLGYPLLGGLIGAVLLMLLVRMAPRQ